MLSYLLELWNVWFWAAGTALTITELGQFFWKWTWGWPAEHSWQVAMILLLVAQFGAYRALAAKTAQDAQRAPSIDIVSFDPVIRPDQNWQVVVRDRIDRTFEMRLQLNSRNLRVEMRNSAGEDSTHERRWVRVEAP